ncbi:MAG: polysaccharide pyruvyl transferase family protein, partial [Candidatus Anammoxibacter sp.]
PLYASFPPPSEMLVSFLMESITGGTLLFRHILKIYDFSGTFYHRRLYKVIYALRSSDIFVITGAHFFEDLLQIFVCLGLFLIAKTFRLPVIIYSISAFPFKTWWDRFVLEPISTDKANNILINEGLDLDKPIIGITTRYLHQKVPRWVKRTHYYTDQRVENANEIIARTVAYLGELAQLVLMPMHPFYREDIEMEKEIKKYLRRPSRLKILSRRYSPSEFIGITGQCRLILASRIVSAVFATITATPIIAIAYDPRMLDHMERIGLSKNVFDWKELKYDDLVTRIHETWSSGNVIKEQLKS